jgi:hypothetical protein
MGKPWATHGQTRRQHTHAGRRRRWSAARSLERTTGFEPATPTLAKKNHMADVSCVSTSLSSAPELHVLGALVSSISPDRWSRLHFVGDFVGVEDPPPSLLQGCDPPLGFPVASQGLARCGPACSACDRGVAGTDLGPRTARGTRRGLAASPPNGAVVLQRTRAQSRLTNPSTRRASVRRHGGIAGATFSRSSRLRLYLREPRPVLLEYQVLLNQRRRPLKRVAEFHEKVRSRDSPPARSGHLSTGLIGAIEHPFPDSGEQLRTLRGPRIPGSVRCPYQHVTGARRDRKKEWFRVTFGLAFQPPIVRSAFRLPVSSVDLSVRSYRLLGTMPYATRRQSRPPGTFDPFSSGPAALLWSRPWWWSSGPGLPPPQRRGSPARASRRVANLILLRAWLAIGDRSDLLEQREPEDPDD